MNAQTDYERFGAVFLSNPGFYSFMKTESAPMELRCHVIYVDTGQFYELWDKNSPSIHPPPAPIDDWEDRKRLSLVWRLLEGPRRPVSIPYVFYDDRGINVIAENGLLIQAFAEWGAKVIPLMVPHSNVESFQKSVGATSLSPINGSHYLKPVEHVLTAFQERSPETIFENNFSKPLKPDEIVQGIRDYTFLIHFQLEILILRYDLYQGNQTSFSNEQKKQDVLHARQLLHQKTVLAHWLTQISDPKDPPICDKNEMVSEEIAIKFLAVNASKYRARNHAHMNFDLVLENLEDNVSPSPPSRNKRPNLQLVSSRLQ